ncbi:hypothetical protein, partial [Brasilonema octagenarum]|uniref:hypothetical protein n=1 Tax=Brasilonema octagenarum TaxID=417105 RepID=UPI00145D3B86
AYAQAACALRLRSRLGRESRHSRCLTTCVDLNKNSDRLIFPHNFCDTHDCVCSLGDRSWFAALITR